MRSGWSGQPLYLSGVKVEVRQGLPVRSLRRHRRAGLLTLEVAKNADTKVCIQSRTTPLLITEYIPAQDDLRRDLGQS